MLTESLNIYVIDKDGNKVTFPNVEGMQPAIVDVNLNRERMAGAPTNTSTLMYPVCLDSYWTKKEFIEIGSERFYVKQVPTSEKNTEDARYKHEITFVSERDILENVFFFDCVAQDTPSQISDKPRSNTTEFSFYGDLNELVQRLNDSLSYSKIYDQKGENGFCIVIDDDVEIGEAKEVSMTDAYFATAMQEIYNVFEVPYYWVGKICHVGYQENEITEPFEYGSGNGLISVQKTNAEFRLINRITGHGSADNIPYYYPNTDPNGIVDFHCSNVVNPDAVEIVVSKVSSWCKDGYIGKTFTLMKSPSIKVFEFDVAEIDGNWSVENYRPTGAPAAARGTVRYSWYMELTHGMRITMENLKATVSSRNEEMAKTKPTEKVYSCCVLRINKDSSAIENEKEEVVPIYKDIVEDGYYRISLYVYFDIWAFKRTDFEPGYAPLNYLTINKSGNLLVTYNSDTDYKVSNGSETVNYEKSGITLTDLENQPCDKSDISLVTYQYYGKWYAFKVDITEKVDNPASVTIDNVRRTNIMSKLMPSVYRETDGAERFYNAENGKYEDEEGNYYSFSNPYLPSEPLEGKQDFDDIKPTINGIANENGELFGEIAELAFDDTDSDDLYIDDANDASANTAKPVHPYFYVKLHRFSGENGFNLFKQGLAQDAMTFNFITGSCAGCSFKVKVSQGAQVDNHYEFKNEVQVDEQGNIVAGDSGDKINVSNPIASQQDTMTNSVWIALEKDNSTFGVLMPNATNNYRPSAGDKFVITNILLPTQYITAAEKRLDAALVKYMSENNDEKFTFSIKFSRIYLQEHPEIAEKINENTKLHVKYNNVDYPLYVSSYTRKSDDNILDEISVELTDKLSISQNKAKEQMKSIMDSIKSSTKKGGASIDYSAEINGLSSQLQNKLSKITDDQASGLITFLSGLISRAIATFSNGAKFGNNFVAGITGEGGMIDGKGNAWLRNLDLSESLTVPKLSYNIVEICPGVQWQSAGGGTIKSVEIEMDADGNATMNGIVTLDLKDGEIGQVKEGDLCLGIFHSTLAEVNETEDKETETGIITRAGFYTCYFRVTKIMEGEFNSKFRYVMRSDDEWSKSVHPSPQMTFVVFGNPTYEDRQKSCYRATNYTRYLAGVTTWKMGVNNIACQIGDLSNLNKIQGYEFLRDYSGFFNNIYITGHVEEIEDMRSEVVMSGIEDNRIEVGGSRTLTFSLRFQNKAINDAKWKMVRESGLAEVDAEWNAAHTDVSSPMVLTSDDMGDGAYLQGVMFTLTGSGEYRYVTGKTVAVEASKSMIITLLSRDELWIDFVPVEGKSFVVKASNVDTIVEARLMYGNADITDAILLRSSSEMEWTRDSGIKEEDNAWVATVGDSPNIIHIIDRANERHDCGSYWMQKLKVSFTFMCKVIFAAEPVTLTGTLGIGNQ